MNVIGHEDIGKDSKTKFLLCCVENVKIPLPIGNINEEGPTFVAPLGNVIGNSTDKDSGGSGHIVRNSKSASIHKSFSTLVSFFILVLSSDKVNFALVLYFDTSILCLSRNK